MIDSSLILPYLFIIYFYPMQAIYSGVVNKQL